MTRQAGFSDPTCIARLPRSRVENPAYILPRFSSRISPLVEPPL